MNGINLLFLRVEYKCKFECMLNDQNCIKSKIERTSKEFNHRHMVNIKQLEHISLVPP